MISRTIEIEENQIKEHARLNLISQSLTLGLCDMGYEHLSIKRLDDKDGLIRFELTDKSKD